MWEKNPNGFFFVNPLTIVHWGIARSPWILVLPWFYISGPFTGLSSCRSPWIWGNISTQMEDVMMLFFQHFLMKNLKHVANLKDFFQWTPCIHQLDSAINILPLFFFIHVIIFKPLLYHYLNVKVEYQGPFLCLCLICEFDFRKPVAIYVSTVRQWAPSQIPRESAPKTCPSVLWVWLDF